MTTKQDVNDAFTDQALYQALAAEDVLDDPEWQRLIKIFLDLKERYCAERADDDHA